MDAGAFSCPHCGAPVDIDFKTRKGLCDSCGSVVTFPRREINHMENVSEQWRACRRCFLDKSFAEAMDHATAILRFAVDHLPALFVRAYYLSFAAEVRKEKYITDFMNNLKDAECDEEEVAEASKVMASVSTRFDRFEKEILSWANEHMSDSELGEFVESFSPALIARRKNIDYFDEEMAALYKEIVTRCSAVKTCYALLQGILKNPDSPFCSNEFFLKTKTRRFYNQYMTPVGEILGVIPQEEYRNKFTRAFQAMHDEITKKMEG